MTRFMGAVAAVGLSCIVVSGAIAQTYGTSDGVCERASGNPVNDTDAYFDGSHFGGQDWGCDLTPTDGDHCAIGERNRLNAT